MYPKHHVILGFIFSLIVFTIFPQIGFLGFSIIFLSSFLIDVDHYLAYALKHNEWNIKKVINGNFAMSKKLLSLPRKKRNKYYGFVAFFHGIEVLLILLILAIFVSPIFLLILTGFLFHETLDTLHQPTYWDRIDKLSSIYDYFKFKKLKDIEDEK